MSQPTITLQEITYNGSSSCGSDDYHDIIKQNQESDVDVVKARGGRFARCAASTRGRRKSVDPTTIADRTSLRIGLHVLTFAARRCSGLSLSELEAIVCRISLYSQRHYRTYYVGGSEVTGLKPNVASLRYSKLLVRSYGNHPRGRAMIRRHAKKLPRSLYLCTSALRN